MFVVEWPRGEARDCKSLYTGSNPVSTSTNFLSRAEGMTVMTEDNSVRPWGRYEVLSSSDVHQVKNLYVLPGKRLSYQRHEKRAEHWFIVSGEARITLDGDSFEMSAGDSIDIEIGVAHRIENIGSEELIFTEVQTGTYFGEDDIERLEDDFGRS
jgi:mannose-6-phosphate isomerase